MPARGRLPRPARPRTVRRDTSRKPRRDSRRIGRRRDHPLGADLRRRQAARLRRPAPRPAPRRTNLALRTHQPLVFPEPPDRFWGHDVSAVADLADKVKAAFDELQDPATAPMRDFDDRDLVHLAEAAGFDRIHLACHIDVEPGSLMPTTSLDALLDAAPNPLAPTLREAINTALTEP